MISHQGEALEDRVLLAVVADDITEDTRWTSNETWYVTRDVLVQPEVELTIDPGTVVQFDTGDSLIVEGTLIAAGTATDKILFTSDRDDTGLDGEPGTTDDIDTEGNGPTTGSPGQWTNIEFRVGSSGSLLRHTEFRFGGAGGRGNVFVNSGPLTLGDSLIRNSSSDGLRIEGASPELNGNIFQGNADAAVSMDLASAPVITAVNMFDNDVNAVAVDGGDLPGDTTWGNPEATYWLSDTVTIPEGVTLTVVPGKTIKGNVGVFDSAGLEVNGTLAASGTESAPIVFTSENDDSIGGTTRSGGTSPGASNGWEGISYSATSTGNLLDHTEVRYAGRKQAGAVVVNGGELSMTGSTILGSSHDGLRIENSTPAVSSSSFVNNADAALSIDLNSNPVLENLTFDGNQINALSLDSGDLPADSTWDDPGVTYLIHELSIPAGTTLTVVPGQVIKADVGVFSSAGITVNGTLVAEGTESQPIVFTSENDHTIGGNVNNQSLPPDSSNGWDGLRFTSTSSGNRVRNLQVRHAGRGFDAAVDVDGSNVRLENVTIRNSSDHGILVRNEGQLEFISSDIFDSVQHGVYVETTSLALIANSVIDANESGIRTTGSGTHATLINNTIVNNEEGLRARDLSTILSVNNIVAYQTRVGVEADAGSTVDLWHSDVYNPQADRGNYRGLDDPEGFRRNLSRDPLFHSRGELSTLGRLSVDRCRLERQHGPGDYRTSRRPPRCLSI